MGKTILVTGATGNVGAEVVRLLQQTEYPFQVAVRNVDAARAKLGTATDYVRFDFTDPTTFADALRDVGQLFLVRPPAISQVKRFIYPLIDTARAAGVEHIVFLSIQAAERNPFVPHRQIETYIQASGISYTFLRASFFMQNLNTVHRQDIQQEGEIFLPAGRGKTSFIDVRDIAAVATIALLEREHRNQAYELTGSQSLDYYQVADIFTAVLGTKIVYSNPSILAFARRMAARGLPLGFILVMIGIYTVARLGLAGRVTQDTARVLGRAPCTMRQYVEDYQNCWRSPGAEPVVSDEA